MISVNMNGLAREINRVAADLQRQAVERVPKAVATEAKQIVIDNSAAGKDIRGRRMKKYTKPYARVKSRKGQPTEPVNLRDTGILLDEQVVDVNGSESSVRPSVDRLLIAEGLMRKREFYPETDTSIPGTFIKRIVKKGEEVMND